ncbi:MAG: DegV family protein [Chloroflexota bacterium]
MVTIVADTTSSIPVPQAQELGIPYIPQIIVFGNETYRDDTEMDSKTFLKRLKESAILPKTAAPPPALYHPVYDKYTQNGNTVIVLTPSSDVSGTFRSAEVAAAEFPGRDIRIVDTRTIGSGLASIVLEAHRWAKEGVDPDTIIQRVRDLSQRERVYFVVDTLEYLYKGGRIGGAKMLVGSLLQVKPILQFKNGRTEPVESQRTKRRAMARLKELVYSDCPHHDGALLTIMHGDAQDEAQALAEEFKTHLGLSTVKIYDLPPAILVHAGPGVIGVSYFVEANPIG